MPSDLTERLAAKLETWMAGDSEVYLDDYGENTLNAKDVAHHAPTILPLLLSEPELVASLPDAVRHKLLLTLVAEQSNIAEAYPRNKYAAEVWNRALHLCPTDGTPIPPVPEEVRLSVLTPLERAGLALADARRKRIVIWDRLFHSAMVLRHGEDNPEHSALMSQFEQANDDEALAAKAFDNACRADAASEVSP